MSPPHPGEKTGALARSVYHLPDIYLDFQEMRRVIDGTGRNDGSKLEKSKWYAKRGVTIKHELLYLHLEFPSERARVVGERGWGLD